jgi:putative endonuclease
LSDASPSSRQPWWRRWFGTRAERAAERQLRRLGHRVLARNWRCPLGELDLVTRDGAEIVFVEVRSSAGDESAPLASVDAKKQRRLVRLALAFLKQHGLLDRPARFDVVVVSWPAQARQAAVHHVPQAFRIEPDRPGSGGMVA